MATFEASLLSTMTPCAPGPARTVASSIARVHGDLLLIHPFREGNGRLARWLADLMALQAGWPPPSYRFTGRGSATRRNAYLSAVGQAYLRECDPLTDFFVEALEASRERSAA